MENKPDRNDKQIAEDIGVFLPFYIPVSPTINQIGILARWERIARLKIEGTAKEHLALAFFKHK